MVYIIWLVLLNVESQASEHVQNSDSILHLACSITQCISSCTLPQGQIWQSLSSTVTGWEWCMVASGFNSVGVTGSFEIFIKL